RLGISLKPGPITDTQGVVIGTHKGVALYTIGQREGLGLARGIPVYVASLDPGNNTVVVGGKQELFKTHFRVKDLVFPSGPLRRKKILNVRIRHLSAESAAEVICSGDTADVIFREPQFAITPGQSAVFYDKDTVVGGGIIQEVVP
ncbi:MAG: tRNA 2-thiouridine(34) synthase MnmA, partial [Candidatus Omnitrophica bacterium]|nr:tRNA 2-thiouridine(34) synthase MnmA [Candidatus Omnitrophota bacterium]